MRTIKKFAIMMLLLGSSYAGLGQTPGTNYIRTRIPQIAVTDTSKLDTIQVQRQAVSIQYSDALGRSWQSVQVQGSPGLKDVIVPFAYDKMGRSVKSYLPYADESLATPGSFRSSATTSAVSFYSPTAPGAAKIPTDTSPFAQTVYEASPLGRVIEQGEVGAVSQPGTGHSVRASYQVNSLADSVRNYESNILTFNYFQAGTLSKTIVTDENGHRLALWKDLQGRTVARTQLDAPTPYYTTGYAYNDLGQLSSIITPRNQSLAYFDDPNYHFSYDSLGRVVEKREPQKGVVYTIYNHSDQPVLSQDSNMRAKNQWAYMKYDAEGRMVQTGTYTNASITSRIAMQHYCDSFSTLWETWQPGVGYTNNAFPTSSSISTYTLFYYDDYSFTEAAAKPFQSNTYGTSPTGRTMGMLTGTSVYVLGTSTQRLVTVNYYDKQNRLIQQIGDNHIGQIDVVNNQYNFIGQLTGSLRSIKPLPSTTVTVKDRYIYDHMNRLMDTYESFNGASEVDISHNVYNEIGQKVTEGLHATGIVPPGSLPATAATITENTTLTTGKYDVATDSVVLKNGFLFTGTPTNTYIAAIGKLFAQTQEFRYNIKGWLTNINNGTLNNDGITQSDPNALFGESITYYETSPLSGNTAQYNGNISGITWRNKIEASGKPGVTTGGQGYNISYDNVNRLTQTGYYTQTGSTFTAAAGNPLTERGLSYDEMGNLKSLERKDKSGTTINSLTYNYARFGNKLTSVTDAGSQSITGTFSYDGNGNMISDSKKGITITYNYLDLPDTVTKGSSKLVITYDAAGNKLYKQLITSGTVVSQKHYIEDAEVTATTSLAFDGKIESIAMDEGRIVNVGSSVYKYEYQLQDHLGNNRVRFRIKPDGTADLTQVQNYYPFGGDMGDTTMNYTTAPNNLYKYSDKELENELDLNTYDFGARHYNPQLGRWMTMDPLAINSVELSPYNYVENNPFNLIDPDGMETGSDGMGWGGQLHEATIHSGSGGSGGGYSLITFGLGAGISAYDAIKAFSRKDVTPTNFSGFKGVQGNTINVNTTGNTFIGGAVLSSGWSIDAADPEPVTKVGGAVIMLGVTANALYQNRRAIANSTEILYHKMTAEIDRIAEKTSGPQGFQYALTASRSGLYPNVRGGFKFLNKGDVWKYGETTKGTRYSQNLLNSMGLIMVRQFAGNQVEIKIQEKIMIYGYFVANGTLPPGNSIFR